MKLHAAYIAGFLDGDGTITVSMVDSKAGSRMRRSCFFVCVSFSNQNLQVLTDIMETLKCGEIRSYLTNGYKSTGCYRLTVPRTELVRVLTFLEPYLRVKREQAQLILKGLETRSRGSHKLTPAVMSLRASIVMRVHELNKRDGKAYRTKWVNSVKTCTLVTRWQAIPSQAVEGLDSTEGVTTRLVSPNNNPAHEDPPRKGKDSLTSTVM